MSDTTGDTYTDEVIRDEAPAEQRADLAALMLAADGAPPAPGAAPAEAEGLAPPSAQSLGLATMLLAAVRPLLCFVVKPLAKAPEELWAPLPEGMAAVLDHYDVGNAEFLRNPWARLGLACVPLAGYVAMNMPSEAEAKPAEPARLEGSGLDLAASAPVPQPEPQRTVTFGPA